MNFFCTKKHLEEWLDETTLSREDVHPLDVESAMDVARAIFDSK
jgi:hypothetical protein